jgi:Ca2+-binding EF-hand superfamily protein
MEIRGFRTIFLLFAICCALAAPTAAQTVPPVGTDATLEETFRRADADGNGALTRNEAIRAKLSLSDKKTFNSVDNDQNGVVTLFELGDALQKRIRSWSSDVGSADRDGDGELSEEEARSNSSLSQIFRSADRNKNGKMDRDEYETFSRRNLYGNVDLPYVAPNIFEKKF